MGKYFLKIPIFGIWKLWKTLLKRLGVFYEKVVFENVCEIFSNVLSYFEKRHCVDLFLRLCSLVVILEYSKGHYSYTSFSNIENAI
jgi:hypothetical protein